MKNLIHKFPVTTRFLLAFSLFGLSLILSGLFNKGAVKEYFPFTSNIFLLITTWVLFKTDNKTLHDIGLNFKIKNLKFLPLGILIGAGVFLLAKYFRALYTGEIINISDTVNYKNILYGLYIILPTVAVEEFLFRGYLFKKTIEISSVIKANIIFAILFALIHILDRNVINNPGMIIFLAITIPVGHLFFATALLKSKSLYFPIGIHLGNNWATRHLISTENNGNNFLYITNNTSFDTWSSFILFILLWNAIFLIATYIIWKWNNFSFIKKKR